MNECPDRSNDPRDRRTINIRDDVDKQRLANLDYEISEAVADDETAMTEKIFDVLKNYSKVDLARYISQLTRLLYKQEVTDQMSTDLYDITHHGTLQDIMPKAIDVVRKYTNEEVMVYLLQLVGGTVNRSYFNLSQRKRAQHLLKRIKEEGNGRNQD